MYHTTLKAMPRDQPNAEVEEIPRSYLRHIPRCNDCYEGQAEGSNNVMTATIPQIGVPRPIEGPSVKSSKSQ